MSFPSDNAATWSALQGLLETALALPEVDRLVWLERSGQVPDELREPLRRLLEVQAGIDTRAFVATFPKSDAGLTPATPVLIGDMVGPYRLLQELGDGGMGSVWLAERADGQLKRKVALKLPRLAWASDLAGRMARERDILGSLEHPNIARLYDAGLDQHGRPFLALEYVEGQRLDRYCDEHRLTLEGRVRLFLQVLDAVQYAHVNLVLHRDLKPANVLVNQRGEVRLLDFGIAKLIAEDSGNGVNEPRSESVSRAMTPRFASPEQVQNVRLTLASDIYSLGVVLYEILIGASPLITNNGSRAEFEIAIVDSRLRTPSRAKFDGDIAHNRRASPQRLSRTLRGDLDAIILKALARYPADRYVSAEAMRADLVRWLEGRPVEATPPSRLVALRKFIARNAAAVSFGSAAVTAIVVVAAIAVLQAREARLESQRATATRDFVLSLFENANPELHGGRDVTVRELLTVVETRLPNVESTDPKIFSDLYSAISNISGGLGDSKRALRFMERRVNLAEQSNSLMMITQALLDYAELAAQLNNKVILDQALERLRKIDSRGNLPQSSKSAYLFFMGWSALKDSRIDEANKYFEIAVTHSRIHGDDEQILRAMYGSIRTNIALGRREDAAEAIGESRKLLAKSSLSERARLNRELELISALYSMGEYSLGLPIIEALSIRSEKTHGKFRQSQRDIYIYRLYWGLQSNNFSEGLIWIEDAKHVAKSGIAGSIEFDIDFQLAEIEYRIAVGDFAIADALLEKADSQGVSLNIESRRRISLMRMHLNLKTGKSDKILSELNRAEWRVNKNDSIGNVWLTYREWYRGMAHALSGNLQDADLSYAAAESVAVREFGPTHPRTSLISLNRLFLKLSSRISGDSRKLKTDKELEMGDSANQIIQSLKLMMPRENASLILIDRCFRLEKTDKQVKRSRISQDMLGGGRCIFT